MFEFMHISYLEKFNTIFELKIGMAMNDKAVKLSQKFCKKANLKMCLNVNLKLCKIFCKNCSTLCYVFF